MWTNLNHLIITFNFKKNVHHIFLPYSHCMTICNKMFCNSVFKLHYSLKLKKKLMKTLSKSENLRPEGHFGSILCFL